MKRDYFEGADVAVTVCAKDGTILDMNQKSRKTFLRPGQPEILGNNVLDCHPEPARTMLADMLAHPRTNVYTVEKEGVKKLIFQLLILVFQLHSQSGADFQMHFTAFYVGLQAIRNRALYTSFFRFPSV